MRDWNCLQSRQSVPAELGSRPVRASCNSTLVPTVRGDSPSSSFHPAAPGWLSLHGWRRKVFHPSIHFCSLIPILMISLAHKGCRARRCKCRKVPCPVLTCDRNLPVSHPTSHLFRNGGTYSFASVCLWKNWRQPHNVSYKASYDVPIPYLPLWDPVSFWLSLKLVSEGVEKWHWLYWIKARSWCPANSDKCMPAFCAWQKVCGGGQIWNHVCITKFADGRVDGNLLNFFRRLWNSTRLPSFS